MHSPEVDAPPEHYFCAAKLSVWANMADQVKEACSHTRAIIGRYFEQKHRDVVSQVTGRSNLKLYSLITLESLHYFVLKSRV